MIYVFAKCKASLQQQKFESRAALHTDWLASGRGARSSLAVVLRTHGTELWYEGRRSMSVKVCPSKTSDGGSCVQT